MLAEIKPSSLDDKTIDALLHAVDSSFSEIFSQIINALIYPRIDELSGEVLDYLAWQFHIEGWELADTEKEKRSLIKNAIELHRYKGTRWAVENALIACGYESYVQEWFEYEGQPYLFKVYTKRLVQNEDVYEKLLSTIYEYKNERSWLQSIGTHHTYEGKMYAGATVWQGSRYVISSNMPDFYVSPMRVKQGVYCRMANYMRIGSANG
ncbi:phage tail protein I [Thermodesulfovibrio yellowstonii]|uniref:phage tail protein I n=1 Tax=Thermodesulfovibrio yellowstonii TaxID=28262 RepID=UPI0024B374C4|nr:phage tail protein I [Thermodesulfovibrio yellowstonii]MDI6865811.1 phage tail protein I [Thermodesulfovibrio yellowstonii]